MSSDVIRWLHLSDFHFGKDKLGQSQVCRNILNKIDKEVDNNNKIDISFITGDIAYTGDKFEYESFLNDFYIPFDELLTRKKCGKSIFIVPGNHDVDRKAAKALQPHTILQHLPTFLDPSEDSLNDRTTLLERFKNFSDMDGIIKNYKKHWLFTKEGTHLEIIKINDNKIGVLCINTAWLSCSENDRHKLTPGKEMISKSMEQLEECNLRVVLGHHPIDWFHDDFVDSIKAIFKKNKIMYLHGHAHKSTIKSALYPFLSIQSAASFQAREDEKSKNGILFANYNFKSQAVELSPFVWSKNNQEWCADTDAFPSEFHDKEKNKWIIPLVGNIDKTPKKEKARDLPYGWVRITTEFLNSYRAALTVDQVISFFDGRVPTWKEALSKDIPIRGLAKKIIQELLISSNETKIILIKGAGGEGKSTILRQVICQLLEKDANQQIIWHDASGDDLPDMDMLENNGKQWVVASDDADIIAAKIFELIKQLHEAGRTDVKFVLACRDTDWIAVRADTFPWQSYSKIHTECLRGLTEEDSITIVKAWSKFGDRGLGELKGLDIDEASKKLLAESKSENSQAEGAFLGAMLRTRIGEGVSGHVKILLSKLNEIKTSCGTLCEAFAYIAVPHALNFLFLSKNVLAEALDLRLTVIKKQVIGPRGSEAAAAESGQYILTRHRAIAEVAVNILSESFHVDSDEIMLELINAVFKLSPKNYVANYNEWLALPKKIYKQGKEELAIRLAISIHKTDPNNAIFIVQLAQLLRESRQAQKSLEIFRTADEHVKRDRTYYFEWCLSEGVCENRCISICLAALSIADDAEKAWTTVENSIIVLAGMGSTFARLYESFHNILFIEAASAAAQLGKYLQSFRSSSKATDSYFDFTINSSRRAGVEFVETNEAVERLLRGVNAAWTQRESELPKWVPEVSMLQYKGFKKLLNLEK